MFETSNVPALFLAPQAPLCLLSAGRSTGVVLDVGEGFAKARRKNKGGRKEGRRKKEGKKRL